MRILLIGIKGTGMSHLASFLKKGGHEIIGMDVDEDFFTSPLLSSIPILPLSSALLDDIDLLIYSSAFEKRSIRAMDEARKGQILSLSYPEMLKKLSLARLSAGVSGTHGKTTTAAVSSYLMEKLGIKGGSIYGSFLKDKKTSYHSGDDYLLIEACEYQEHFLLYSLSILVITNIEFDHPDYFKDISAVREAFHKRFVSLERNAVVIAHSSIKALVDVWREERKDIRVIYYGLNTSYDVDSLAFLMSRKIAEDYIAASLCVSLMSLKLEFDEKTLMDEFKKITSLLDVPCQIAARNEVVKEQDGIVYIDEYAHHPSEIRVSIENLRIRYPGSRLVVIFMPHTSSRTEALLDDFSSTLSLSDTLILQSVYSSARGDVSSYDSSKLLIERIWEKKGRDNYLYIPNEAECLSFVSSFLKRGDVCITMGAGNNRFLIDKIIELKEKL